MKDKETKYDAILIPGGGIKGKNDVPPWVRPRLDRAVELHQDQYIIALSAGTTHKPPPMDDEGFPVFESIVSADYLVKKGIPRQKILRETCSYDTIGNAYFARTIHTDPRGLRTLLIITSAFHMPRTRTIFEWVFDDAAYELHFEAVPDQGMDENLLKVKKEKEKKSLENVLHLKKKIRTFEQLHNWLFTEHEAYAAGLTPVRIKGEIVNTY
jgi:uncharacterized SAM-binding protein YcdF (DUF218 family)